MGIAKQESMSNAKAGGLLVLLAQTAGSLKCTEQTDLDQSKQKRDLCMQLIPTICTVDPNNEPLCMPLKQCSSQDHDSFDMSLSWHK